MIIRGCVAMTALMVFMNLNAAASDSGIRVVMNQAKVVKLSRAADTVIVGNPEIADAAIQDSNTVVLTGKGFGTTNFVVMDENGNAIVDELIMVSRDDTKITRIFRGTAVETVSCTPFCETANRTASEKRADEEAAAAQSAN